MATADPDVVAIVQNLGVSTMRERLWATNPSQNDAIDSTGLQIIGTPGVLSDSEATVRGRIQAIAGQARAGQVMAFLGPNEVDSMSNGNRDWGNSWAQDSVRFCSWVWDEVRNGGHASLRHAIVGGAVLKHNGVPLDDDIAELKAARYSGLSMDDVTDAGDWHHYSGRPGPGARVDGRDGNGVRPTGIVLGADGMCSVEHFEMQRFRQIYNDPAKPMLHTEWGWTTGQSAQRGGGRTGATDADAAQLAVETYLRDYHLGVVYSAIYEAIDEYPAYSQPNHDPPIYNDESFFGQYVMTNNPLNQAGAKPSYTALQQLFGYTGSQSFTGVGWVEPHAGVVPDCGVSVFSKASGGFDVYLLREARVVCDVVTAPGHLVAGRSPDTTDGYGNRRYSIDFGDKTMLSLAVS